VFREHKLDNKQSLHLPTFGKNKHKRLFFSSLGAVSKACSRSVRKRWKTSFQSFSSLAWV